MSKEEFSYPQTGELLSLLDDAAARSGLSRGEAFDDFLLMSVCALSGGQMEDQYMETVRKHTHGEMGRRGCDAIADMFARLVLIMQETRQDVLGDLFQGAVSHGEHQFYVTPKPVAAFMARLTMHEAMKFGHDPPTVWDPSCGSGRLLLSAADQRRDSFFIGQDIDLACVRITSLNLALRNLYGCVFWGDTLIRERKLAYRTGYNGRGFIAEVPVELCPYPDEDRAPAAFTIDTERPTKIEATDNSVSPGKQLTLF